MLKYAILTDIGSREVNEDSIGAYENKGNYGFIVCDGLGGHGMGDLASKCIRDVFEDQFYKTEDMTNFIGQTFMAGQQILLMEQQNRHARHKMKTTAVALVTDAKKAYIGYIGDSRLYVFNKNRVKTRTLDHSIPQMLVLSRQIKENEIRYHPDRNIVLRAMGVEWEEAMYELISPIDLKKCQAFLLCTDGFWELILEEEMCRLLKEASSPEDWLKAMQNVIRANGTDKNMDNYSAIAVWNVKK